VKSKVDRILGNISDSEDEVKKEREFDFDASYKISLNTARNYNQLLCNDRAQFQSHFLKRKIKAAYEREPLEKNKGFFNVPFIPNIQMFQSPSQPTTSANVVPNNQDKKPIMNKTPSSNNIPRAGIHKISSPQNSSNSQNQANINQCNPHLGKYNQL